MNMQGIYLVSIRVMRTIVKYSFPMAKKGEPK